MALHVGQLIRGTKATYRILQPLKADTVFKAQIVDSVNIREKWAVVKSFSDQDERRLLVREFQNYQIPTIATSPYIRCMYEAIGSFDNPGTSEPLVAGQEEPPCLILEWMDTDLWQLPSATYRSSTTAALSRSVIRSILSALVVFEKNGQVHTDINPNNILLSQHDTSTPVVKVSDLGILIQEGITKKRLQSRACRAPEVWKGYGVCHASDVWSVGVTLTHWLLGTTIFGAADKIIEGGTEPWCIAKIERLIGPLGPFHGPTEIEDEFDFAAHIRDLDAGPPVGKLIKVKTLREELQLVTEPSIAPGLIDFVESLLVLDPAERPTAEEALQHPFLQ